ncbi:MAG: glycine oxidase ThiO [Planctomycetaceae bacterium]|nr:glycine oxidase ThiO [Planctomycetaceae bacterium]
MPDVVVIGGGVVGLTIAYELAQSGAQVSVLDRTEFGREASWAGAGMIPPGASAHAPQSLQSLSIAARARWPQLSAELRELTGVDNEFAECGSLLFPARENWDEEIAEWSGVPHTVITDDPVTLKELAPTLSPKHGTALHLPTAAQVRNPPHLRALTAACEKLGVTILPNREATGFRQAGSQVTEVETSDGNVAADCFVVAAGAWSTDLLKSTGVELDVEPVRGQIRMFKCEQQPFIPLLEVGPRYLVPRADGRVLAGSTEEWVGFEKHTTPKGMEELHKFAIDLVPCLAEATVELTWSGLRPYSRRGFPHVGRAPNLENLLIATGHFRAGLSLSPATALEVRRMVLEPETGPTYPDLLPESNSPSNH